MTRRQTQLRPEQGGRFHAPVGPPADHPARQPEKIFARDFKGPLEHDPAKEAQIAHVLKSWTGGADLGLTLHPVRDDRLEHYFEFDDPIPRPAPGTESKTIEVGLVSTGTDVDASVVRAVRKTLNLGPNESTIVAVMDLKEHADSGRGPAGGPSYKPSNALVHKRYHDVQAALGVKPGDSTVAVAHSVMTALKQAELKLANLRDELAKEVARGNEMRLELTLRNIEPSPTKTEPLVGTILTDAFYSRDEIPGLGYVVGLDVETSYDCTMVTYRIRQPRR